MYGTVWCDVATLVYAVGARSGTTSDGKVGCGLVQRRDGTAPFILFGLIEPCVFVKLRFPIRLGDAGRYAVPAVDLMPRRT
jgi:hypothetical protein